MTGKLKVAGFDDRSGGTLEHGYIDFTDGLRIGYAPGTRQADELGLFDADQPYLEAQKGKEPGPRHWLLASEWARTYLTPVPWSVEAVVVVDARPTDDQLEQMAHLTGRPVLYKADDKELHLLLTVEKKRAGGPPLVEGSAALRKTIDIIPGTTFTVTDFRVRIDNTPASAG